MGRPKFALTYTEAALSFLSDSTGMPPARAGADRTSRPATMANRRIRRMGNLEKNADERPSTIPALSPSFNRFAMIAGTRQASSGQNDVSQNHSRRLQVTAD